MKPIRFRGGWFSALLLAARIGWAEDCPSPLLGQFPACEPPANKTYIGEYYARFDPAPDEHKNFEGAIGQRVLIVGDVRSLSTDDDQVPDALRDILYEGLRDPERDTSLRDTQGRLMSPYVPSIELAPFSDGHWWDPRLMVVSGHPYHRVMENVARLLKENYEKTHRPTFVIPWWEIERQWQDRVSPQNPGATLQDLKRAWCEMYNVFKNADAHAIFVWHTLPQIDELRGDPPHDAPPEQVWMDYYPGDACVDWFGMSGFVAGIPQSDLFARDAARHGKKVMLVEFGTAEPNCFSAPPNAHGPPPGEDDEGYGWAWHRSWFDWIHQTPHLGAFQYGPGDDCAHSPDYPWGDHRLNGTALGNWMREEFKGGHGGAQSYQASGPLISVPSGFELTVDPSSQTVRAGNRVSFQLTLTADPGASSTQEFPLTLVSSPTITGAFSPPTVTPTRPAGARSILTVSVRADTTPSPNYKLWIRAEKGYVTRIARVTLNVQSPDSESPPTISQIQAPPAQLSPRQAKITWETDQSASSQVFYGLTPDYDLETAANASLVISHQVALTRLAPITTYHYKVKSCNAQSRCAESVDHTFTTLRLGDANGDERIDALDLQLCINLLTQTQTQPEPIHSRCRLKEPPSAPVDQTDIDALARLIASSP